MKSGIAAMAHVAFFYKDDQSKTRLGEFFCVLIYYLKGNIIISYWFPYIQVRRNFL